MCGVVLKNIAGLYINLITEAHISSIGIAEDADRLNQIRYRIGKAKGRNLRNF